MRTPPHTHTHYMMSRECKVDQTAHTATHMLTLEDLESPALDGLLTDLPVLLAIPVACWEYMHLTALFKVPGIHAGRWNA